MNEEMINVVTEAVEPAIDLVETTAKKSGKGAAIVVAAVAGVFVVGGIIVGGIKFGAKAIKEHKEKKELRKPDEGTVVEPTQEQLDEVVK